MIKTKKAALWVLVSITLLYYGWIMLEGENENLRLFGNFVFSILGGAISFSWLYRAYKTIKNRQRYFWLLLSIGTLLFIFTNIIGVVYTFYKLDNFYDSYFWVWVLAYAVFLVALIYKVQLISITESNGDFIFNILISMTISASIAIYFLMKPILSVSANDIEISTIIIIYPIVNLCILLVTIVLFYIASYSENKKSILMITYGFFTQIIADLSYIYQNLMGTYRLGGFIDPIWLLAILLIGFASFSAHEHSFQSNRKEKNISSRNKFFPYFGIVLLVYLVIDSYHWDFNALSIGIFIVFILLLIRQFLITKQNDSVMEEYKFLAYHDPLTGLNNRTIFKEDLEKFITYAKSKNEKIALLLIDLDRFKNINDTLGHFVGDNLLKASAERLADCLSKGDQLYRLGGDEFIIISLNGNECTSKRLAGNIINRFKEPFVVLEHEIPITPSIGIGMYPENGQDFETLFKNTDAAMYQAKNNGKNNYQFHDQQLNEIINRKVMLETEMIKAIEKDELLLAYQSKVELKSEKLIGFEALLRWNHPYMGWVSPNEFIPIAEESGHIVAIGEWVLREACKQNKQWQEQGYAPNPVSVNVSVRQFQHNDFVKTVSSVLNETGLDPQYLELEITESIIQNIKESKEVLDSLRAIGVKVSIDDFGTGYSSLHVLKELSIDTIKIDKSFIDDIGELKNKSMIKTIIDLGLNLNLNVVAEGIEYEYQSQALQELDCHIGQGYLYTKPIFPTQFQQLLKHGDGSPASTTYEEA